MIKKEDTTFIFHNAMYDVCWLRAAGIQIKGKIVDTMIAASLINENRLSYRLDSLAKEYVGIGKDEKVLQEAAKAWTIDAKKDMWRLPAMFVGQYAERDAESTLKLWQRLQSELYAQELFDIFNLETKLFPCLVDMRFKGVRVNLEKANKIKENLISQEKNILHKIKKLTNIDVEIWAAASIAKVFEKLKLPFDKTEKTGAPSFTKNFLANHPNEIAQDIANAREINKAHTTFIDTITKHSVKGRIHADINQIRSDAGGTVTGRFSMSNPNLQQIPARHKELGPMIRSIFIPEENCKWGSALNRLIQGSAADMTKKSMVCLYENGIIPHIQIHDEVDISVESDKKAEKIIEIMESTVELKVPNKVDYEQGNNWGEIK
jgi:DNA polymerase I-like protein with 3'-5' exonuclease and polymerase domains